MHRSLTTLGLLLATASLESAGLSMTAQRLAHPIRVDGRLDEPEWRMDQAPRLRFQVQWPAYGEPSQLETQVQVRYDDEAIYIGARMLHPEGGQGIRQRLHRRDQDSSSDWFGVFLDSQHDRRTAWGFLVNAAGVQRDVLRHSDTLEDSSWDAVWESAVTVDERGWTAELRIPLALLRLQPTEGPQVWGINFTRSNQGTIREFTQWSLPPRSQNGFVSAFPELNGMEGLRPQARREFIPYLSAQRKFETAQPFDDRTWKGRAGLDVHLGLGANSQLDGTIRPDFGQVEVDQQVINLSTYETFYQEKRPFFLEGMDLFQFPESRLFYSRRIGRGAYLSLAEGETVREAPGAAEIRAAAKLTSRSPGGFSWGVLAANLEPARGRVLTQDGHEEVREAQPAAGAGVVRAQQDLDDHGSTLGFLGTFLGQAGSQGREAQVGGLDLTWKSRDLTSTFVATAAGSHAGAPGDVHGGGRFYAKWNQRWKGGWNASLVHVEAGRRFDPNDLGYLRRADLSQTVVDLERAFDGLTGYVRTLSLGGGGTYSQDQAGRPLERSLSGRLRLDTADYLSFWASAGASLAAYDDREWRTFSDPVKRYLRRPSLPWVDLTLDTAGNKPYYVRVSYHGERHEGGPAHMADLLQVVRPTPSLEISFEAASTTETGRRAYMGVFQDTPLVGLRRLRQYDQTLRVAYAFSPWASLQVFSQWLAASWSFREAAAYRTDDTLVAVQDPGPSPSSERLWNLNAIARWEFRPGSTAYLVYTHGASSNLLLSERGSLAPWRALRPVNHLPSDDIVQLKVSWLFR